MFVIITDGEENSSREYSAKKIKSLIKNQKKKYGWEFIFLGANIDAIKTAGSFGIAQGMAVNYISDSIGTRLNYKAMAQTVASFREKGTVDSTYFDEIRDDVKNRGNK